MQQSKKNLYFVLTVSTGRIHKENPDISLCKSTQCESDPRAEKMARVSVVSFYQLILNGNTEINILIKIILLLLFHPKFYEAGLLFDEISK